MKEIRDKTRIQIEITSACIFSCTNCYKFVGHYGKPYFMDLVTFKKAIDSLEGYQGQFGITGGEPTLHPDFSEICKYIRKKVPPDQRYLQTTGHRWQEYKTIIKKTFAHRVAFNDHKDMTQKHHPVLVAIKDIVDDAKLKRELIDKCWVIEKWSSVINSKGCYFCEITGAFDVLYDGPGGHPIEKGWWKKDYQDFSEQMDRYCQLCGAALPQPQTTVDINKDLVSISNYKLLEKLRTPKMQNDRVLLVDKKCSAQDIKLISETWEPWHHLGEGGQGETICQRYGSINSFFLRHRLRFRNRFNYFKILEKHTGRLLWRFARNIGLPT